MIDSSPQDLGVTSTISSTTTSITSKSPIGMPNCQALYCVPSDFYYFQPAFSSRALSIWSPSYNYNCLVREKMQRKLTHFLLFNKKPATLVLSLTCPPTLLTTRPYYNVEALFIYVNFLRVWSSGIICRTASYNSSVDRVIPYHTFKNILDNVRYLYKVG